MSRLKYQNLAQLKEMIRSGFKGHESDTDIDHIKADALDSVIHFAREGYINRAMIYDVLILLDELIGDRPS